jgi:ssDNA-binding Zn-finger/Zn-ribbon topoisomerase 1
MDASALPADCTKCRHQLWDSELAAGRWVCAKCERDAFQRIRELPVLFAKLDRVEALMKGSGSGQIGGPSRELGSPLKLAVLAVTANGGVVTQLQAIEDAWRKALGWSMGETRHRADIAGATTFLINQLGWACSNYPDVSDDLLVIQQLHTRLGRLDTGEPQARKFEVHCAAAGCDGRWRVSFDYDGTRCPSCRAEYNRREMMRLDSEFGPNLVRMQEDHAA